MRILLLLGMVAFANPIFDHQPEQAIKTTICAIKSDPSVFNGKLVEVAGYATHGLTTRCLKTRTCFWARSTRNLDAVWGNAGLGGHEAKPLMVQGVGVVMVHDSQFAQMDKLLHSSSKDLSVKATVRARFFVNSGDAEGKHDVGKGYGKRAAACYSRSSR